MRNLLLVIILVGLVFSMSCKNIRERGLFGKKARSLEMLMAQQDSIRKADSLKRVENRLKAIEEAYLDSLQQAKEEKLANEARNRYNIIVGSFLTPEYAAGWAEEYRKQGYDPEVIEPSDSEFDLVVVESYDRYAVAAERLERFQDTVELDAWLYVRK
jgi:hypothetical protein